MDQELKQHLEAMETRFDKKLEALVVMMRGIETNLLTEFHKWASPADARAKTHAAVLRAIDLEMER